MVQILGKSADKISTLIINKTKQMELLILYLKTSSRTTKKKQLYRQKSPRLCTVCNSFC